MSKNRKPSDAPACPPELIKAALQFMMRTSPAGEEARTHVAAQDVLIALIEAASEGRLAITPRSAPTSD